MSILNVQIVQPYWRILSFAHRLLSNVKVMEITIIYFAVFIKPLASHHTSE